MITKLQNSYWNNNGQFQRMVDELQAANVEIKGCKTYYRFYNDGDFPRGIRGIDMFSSQEEIEIRLEQWMDANVLEAYAKFLRK